jgi:hypothetical protein
MPLPLPPGRAPNTKNLGLEEAGVQMGPKGQIVVDEYCKSSVPSIWAVGDVIDRIQVCVCARVCACVWVWVRVWVWVCNVQVWVWMWIWVQVRVLVRCSKCIFTFTRRARQCCSLVVVFMYGTAAFSVQCMCASPTCVLSPQIHIPLC